MSPAECVRLDAVGLVELVATGEVSPIELETAAREAA